VRRIAAISAPAGLDIPTPFNGALEAGTIPQVADIVAAARELGRSGQETKAA
jgi:pyruvate dehydrogenase E1 component beta subunit